MLMQRVNVYQCRGFCCAIGPEHVTCQICYLKLATPFYDRWKLFPLVSCKGLITNPIRNFVPVCEVLNSVNFSRGRGGNFVKKRLR